MKRKIILSAALVLALVLCLVPAAAYAAPKASPSASPLPSAAASPSPSSKTDTGNAASSNLADAVINAAEETLYNDGNTVFNNFGTVYNNEGTVYNNGGTTYNNGGLVYNNGGVVYNNGGTVYNNSGTVYNNDGSVEESAVPVIDGSAEEADSGPYKITLSADCSGLAEIEGLDKGKDGEYYIEKDAVCTITPADGVTITDALTTSGMCVMDDEGNVELKNADRDGELTLKFKLDAPVISPASASYGGTVKVSMSAADGAAIYYTLDGSAPTEKSLKYTKPVEIDESCVIKAAAYLDGAETSETAEETYVYAEIEAPRFDDADVGYEQPEKAAVVVKNTGLDDFVIKSVNLDGKDKDSFVLSTERGGKIASGQSDDKTWTVAPKAGLAAGSYKAELVFTLDSGDAVSAELSFTVKKAAASAKSA